MISRTITDADIQAAKAKVLRQRGVPEKFVNAIAAIDNCDKFRDPPFGVGMILVIALALILIFLMYFCGKHLVGWTYGAQVQHSDMFVTTSYAFAGACMWVSFSTVIVVPLVFAALARRSTFRYGLRGEIQPLRPAAFCLCDRGGRRLDQITADPRWAALADLPSAKAFLAEAGRQMSPVELNAQALSDRRVLWFGVGGLILWALATWGICAWALTSYTAIRNDTIEYRGVGSHLTLPLAQITDVKTSCSQSKHSVSLDYDLEFGGHNVDLFGADNLISNDELLDRMVAIDAYLKAHGVPMHKLAPYDQLSRDEQNCLDSARAGDDARKRQLIFTSPAG